MKDETKTKFDELVKIQCSPGNWDYDPYMHGMANGMLLAQAMIRDTGEPAYLTAPSSWGRDRTPTGPPTSVTEIAPIATDPARSDK
jgi:hypothetical protein